MSAVLPIMRGARWLVCLAGILLGGCTAALSPKGARVAVYEAPMDAGPPERSMPKGCRLLAASPQETLTELDLEGQKDPLRQYRNDAGSIGANALLVLKRPIVSRHDSECPASSPITDCPPSFGVWFQVVIESYVCTADALEALSNLPPNSARDLGRIPVAGTRPGSPQ